MDVITLVKARRVVVQSGEGEWWSRWGDTNTEMIRKYAGYGGGGQVKAKLRLCITYYHDVISLNFYLNLNLIFTWTSILKLQCTKEIEISTKLENFRKWKWKWFFTSLKGVENAMHSSSLGSLFSLGKCNSYPYRFNILYKKEEGGGACTLSFNPSPYMSLDIGIGKLDFLASVCST